MRTRSRGTFDERPVDRRDDALDEAEEVAERPVLIGDVALEREVGAVELQQEAVADDRLVLDPERVGERRRGRPPRSRSARSSSPRRRCPARARSGTARRSRSVCVEHGAEIVAFGVDGGRVEIAHLADRLRRPEVADRGPAGHLLLEHAPGRSGSGRRRRAAGAARRRRSRSSDAARRGRSPRAAARRCCRRRSRRRSAWAPPSAAPACPAAASSAGSTASPCARRTYSRTSSGGRGRLPACVVRIRSSLRRMAASVPVRIACAVHSHAPSSGTDAARAAAASCWSSVASGASSRRGKLEIGGVIDRSAGALAREPGRLRSPARGRS